MANEMEQYLMEKFRNTLQQENSRSKIALFSYFNEIFKELEKLMTQSSHVAVNRGWLYYLDNALTECQTLGRKHALFNSAPRGIEKKLKQILSDLRDPKWLVNSNGHIASQLASEFAPLTTRNLDFTVHGFDEEIISVEKLLLRDDTKFKAVGVVGIRGIGKTTLCKVLFAKEELKTQFLPRIWVCMSKQRDDDPDPKVEIVKRMLESLGMEKEMIDSIKENHGLGGLTYSLHLQLIGKKYLIILDDATVRDDWFSDLNSGLVRNHKWDYRFRYGLPRGNGGTVIVTSRDGGLMKEMVGDGNVHRIEPISDPEKCWMIFEDAVRKDGILYKPINEKELKKDFEHKCGGIPLAAKMMGDIVHQQIPDQGNVATNQVQSDGA